MGQQLYYDNYSPVGDILVVAICFLIFILIGTSYVTKTRSFAVYVCLVVFLTFAGISGISHHFLYSQVTDGDYTWVYILRILYHAFLFSNLLLYVVYIVELQHLEKDKKIPVMIISSLIYILIILADIITTISGNGFKLNRYGTAVSAVNIFLYGYLAFIAVISFLMIVFRNRLYKQVMMGFYGTMAVAFLLLVIQGKHGQSSFTTATFTFPVISMLYIVHSNPYDIELGAINISAMEDMVRYNYKRKNELIFMSLYMPDYDVEGAAFPKEMQKTIRDIAGHYFRGAVLFQVNNGHVILMTRKDKNPNFENIVNKTLNAFDKEYEKYKLDYKIVFGESIEEISRKNEYISFIRNIHRNMEMNSIHMVDFEDVEAFNKYELILSELDDIYKKHDLNDPRVMAYCQPVYNIKKQKYDTAEALMRLKLDDIGLVFPDQFIPLAEENGYIHVLTEIILSKTCAEIKHLLGDGYEVKRISINVSVLEMRDDKFTEDITNIINNSGIPEYKVAIEITESQTDNDFLVMKHIIDELKDKGVKFYLDDFGTGYSNMERIMELPFDIIKFDRSLVLASDTDERAEKMVGSLANMFSELNYSVLYEGVENEMDEKRCINMSASYLQGYKYSRPIPIIELSKFFSKQENNHE